MGNIKTNGIIIAENNFKDYDKMLTMLTPGFGKIGCVAKGSRRPKSLLLAGSQFLCFGEYLLYKGSGAYIINSCETIELFYNLRMDLDKLRYASHITKIIYDVTTENQNSYKILQLFLNTLYVLSNSDMNMDLIIAIFKLRLISILGFVPNVKECTVCKKENTAGKIQYFSFKNSGFGCNICGKQDTSAIKISEATVDAIRYIIYASAKKVFSFQVPEDIIKELELISKLYMNEKLEKEYKLEKLF